MLIDEVAHGGQVRGVLGERGGQGRLESRGAVGIEQIGQAARERAQVHAAQRRGGEELRATRRRVVQPIHRPVSPGGALLVGQVLDMRGILDLLVAIVAARMGGDDGTGIEDAHGIWGGTDLERAPYVGVRDRVVVPVEARVRVFYAPAR